MNPENAPDRALSCWIVTDGKAGTETQCIGLANALGLKPVIKRVQLRLFWRLFTPFIRFFDHQAFSPKGDSVKGPWPQILIASGRRSLPAVFAARRAMGRNIFIIYLQNPRCSLKWFDIVIAPHHDQLYGKNVINTIGALNKVTKEAIETGTQAHAKRFKGLPSPLTAVMLGGTSSAYTFDERQMKQLVDQFEKLLWKSSGSLLISPSRRTGANAIAMLKRRLGNHPRCWIWDMQSENPYFAMLGMADTIMVTADSVSMISEAATTGKPIYVIPLQGGSKKFSLFHNNFIKAGITRPFTGALDYWDYEPLQETQNVAAYVKRMLQERFS